MAYTQESALKSISLAQLISALQRRGWEKVKEENTNLKALSVESVFNLKACYVKTSA